MAAVNAPQRTWTGTDATQVVLPRALVAVLDGFLKERFPQATPRRLAEDVARLSESFTAEREELPGSYLNHPPSRSAYLSFFHQTQVLRAMAALDEVRIRATARGLWVAAAPDDVGAPTAPLSGTEASVTPAAAAASPEKTLRVLDLGAGLGAMSQALLATGGLPGKIEFTLVDHQKSALADARELLLRASAALRPGAPPPLVRCVASRIEPWLGRAGHERWQYDVALLGGVLNELQGEWMKVVDRTLGLLDGPALLVIVEPALPPVGRALQALRDEFLAVTTTIAPCTHGLACPLAKLTKDWCFTTRPAQFTDRVAEQARRLEHQWSEVRYAFWAAVARPNAAPPEIDPSRHGRVVSDPVPGGQVICVLGEKLRLPERARQVRRGALMTR